MSKRIPLIALFLCSTPVILTGCNNDSGDNNKKESTEINADIVPGNHMVITADQVITLYFDDKVDSASLRTSGDLANEGGTYEVGTNSKGRTYVKFIPSQGEVKEWVTGSDRTFSIDLNTADGTPMETISLSYDIVPADSIFYYVDPVQGDDTAAGLTRDTPIRSLQKAIFDASPNSYILVKGGTYYVTHENGSHLFIDKDYLHIYGSLDSEFNSRNVDSATTIVTDISMSGGPGWSPSATVYISGSEVTLASFAINGPNVAESRAIQINSQGGVILKDSDLKGGNEQIGALIWIDQHTLHPSSAIATTISNNRITAGNFPIKAYAPAVVKDNDIQLLVGIGPTNQYLATSAVYLYAGGSVTGNVIKTEMDATVPTVYGITLIDTTKTQDSVVANNTISMYGESTSNNYGISIVDGQSTTVYNNVISTIAQGTIGNTFGIEVATTATVKIYNNTINGGNGTSSSGIYIPGVAANAEVINNIIIASSSGTSRCLDAGSQSFAKIQNNDLFNCTHLLRSGNTDYDTTTAINGVVANTSANVSTAPLFVNQTGSDGVEGTLNDNDWRLSASTPTSVTQGGQDLSATIGTSDMDGSTRSSPWSMGAYEK